MKNPIILAHRGASGYEPENTLRAFRRAIELGADGVELDVHLCRSGELVVIHDSTVNRTTNGIGRVSDMALEELKRLDAGKGEKTSTLEEVIRALGKDAIINIELKGKGTVSPLAQLLDTFVKKHGWPPESFIVSSFSRTKLREFVKINSEIRLGLLTMGAPLDVFIGAFLHNLYVIYLPRWYMKKWIISFFQKRGLRVFLFTLNGPDDMSLAKELGVYGVVTDYPDRV